MIRNTDEAFLGDPLGIARDYYALSMQNLQKNNLQRAIAEALLGILRLQIDHAERQQL